MIHTICFVLGVSFAFFILGLGVSAAAGFFKTNQMLFARIGGLSLIHICLGRVKYWEQKEGFRSN